MMVSANYSESAQPIYFLLIDLLQATNVYYQIVGQNENKERWTAVLNCKQFARVFVTQALGLRWPDIEVAGDTLPLIIDLRTMYLSSKKNRKKKKQPKRPSA